MNISKLFLFVFMLFFFSSVVSATTITDDFESYPIGSFNNTGQSNWSIQMGTWEIINGDTNKLHPSTTSESRLKLQNFSGRNFNMSVDMMCNSSSGYNGLLVRWDGSSATSFLVDTSVQHNVIRLWTPISSSGYKLLKSTSYTFNQFQEYNIRITSNDSKLTFYVDEIEALNYTDFFRQDTIMSEGGYVGLYGKSNVFFDNFSIETLIENDEYLNYFDYTNVDNNSVTLKWSLSGYNNATIRRGTDIDIINTEIYHGAATTYIDNGLSVDTNYYYSITYDNSTDGHIIKAFTYNIPTTKKYVAFGDSITVGLGLPANESYPYRLNKTIATNIDSNITHSISALSGYTSNGVIFEQLDDILTEKPTFTTLMIGFNDFNIDGSDEDNYHANFNYIINESTKHGIDCFILKIINTSNPNVQPHVEDTNIWIDSLEHEYVVDTYDAVDLIPFDENIQGYNTSFYSDGAHLNSIGTKNINKSIYDYMISVDYFEEDSNPPVSITSLTNTTGNFWHNWTWTNPTDSDFNHTMIYLNNVFTTNISNTTTFYNYTVSPHNVSTISTHTVDITGNINSTWVNHTSVIGNNPITLLDGGSYDTWNESENVYVALAYSDADSDSPVEYATNRTDLFTDFHSPTGSGHWQTDYTDAGVYHIGFNVSDGYGSIGNLTFVLTINNIILPPQNLTSITSTEQIHYNWDDDIDADYWNISQLDITIPFTSAYAVLDGIKDACYTCCCAYGFVGDAPNPYTIHGKETIYILRNDTYLILYADGEDNDNFNNDDNFIIGIDASNNNLTTDDRKFILGEGGTVTAKGWTGSAWNPVSTNAQGVVVGGGAAGAIQYEMFIPVSELDTNFTNGSTVKFFMSRTHTASNPDVESYYPQTLINTTDAALWQSVLLSSEAQYTYINNTTTSNYTVTGLDPFTWYQHKFVTINGTQESSGVNSADITLDTPAYSVSGYIKDISGNPIVNADVWGENGYPLEHNVSNASGYYIGMHFHNGTYTIYANTTGYSQNNSGVVTIAGTNLTNVNITLISSNYDNFTFTNAQVSPSAIFEGKPFTISVDINDSDGAIATAIVKIDGTNYTMTNSTGDTWTYTFTDTAIPTRYFVQNFYAQDNASAWNSTTSTLSVIALPSTGTGGFGGRPTDIPEPVPEPVPEEELIPEEPTDIGSIFDVLEEKLSEATNITTIKNIFKSKAVALVGVKYTVGDYSTTKEIVKPEALTCESTDPRVSCGVIDGIVTIVVIPTTDDSKLYQLTDAYVKITNNDGNTYHLPVSLSLINLMWYFDFNMDTGIENPYIVAGGINTDATVGIRGWWVTAIAGLITLGFIRKYN